MNLNQCGKRRRERVRSTPLRWIQVGQQPPPSTRQGKSFGYGTNFLNTFRTSPPDVVVCSQRTNGPFTRASKPGTFRFRNASTYADA